MIYFNLNFEIFFRELTKNNTTLWFNEHRKTYEQEVKKPFNQFVGDMIELIGKYEPDIKIKPADAVMRINKDIRFNKDKTPYNTHVAANISVYGKKDKSFPGFYFQLSHDKIMIYGGVYMAEPPTLLKIRKHIAWNPDEFSSAYKDKNFRDKFDVIHGEKHKRLPEEFLNIAAKEPLIANKQFYYMAELSPDILFKDGLPDKMMEYYLAGKKLNDFLKEAIKS